MSKKRLIEVASKTGKTHYFAQVAITPTPTALEIVENPSNERQITPHQAELLRSAARECPNVLHVGDPGALKSENSDLRAENARLKARIAELEKRTR